MFKFKLLLIGCMVLQLSLYGDSTEEAVWIQPQEIDAFENHFHQYDAPVIPLGHCVEDFTLGFVLGSLWGSSMKSLYFQKRIDSSFATEFFAYNIGSLGSFIVCLKHKEHAEQATTLFAGFSYGSVLSFLALYAFDHEEL